MNAEVGSGLSERARAHALENGWWHGELASYGTTWTGWHLNGSDGVSRSCHDNHIQEMFDHDHRCEECGDWIDVMTSRAARLIATRRCFNCDHYEQHLAEWDPERDVVVVDTSGRRRGYHIAPPTSSPNHCKGHGGSRFTVLFIDGPKVVTDNLWCWSDRIPDHFHDRFPVNANFERAR